MYIVICDVDGTLTGDANGISQFNRVVALHRNNLYVVYSSGRYKESLLEIIKKSKLITPDAICANVGTEIYYGPDWELDTLWDTRMKTAWNRKKVSAALADQDLVCQPYTKKYVLSYFVEDSSVVNTVKNMVSDLPVQVVYSMQKFLDIIPETAGKGNAAVYMQKKVNGKLVCCGDSENDENMLKTSDYGVLVNNASCELKKRLCSHVYVASQCHATGCVEGMKFFGIV